MDPFLWLFQAAIDFKGYGITRACADDVGMAIRSISHLTSVFPIFVFARRVAGLTLKPKKIVIVPVGVLPSEAIVDRVRAFLHVHVPEWAAVSVAGAAKYLGFWLGPRAASVAWSAPLSKWRARAVSIAITGAPASAAARLYNSRAAPVVQYGAQLLLPPKCIRRRESFTLHKLLHLPPNVFDYGSLFHLDSVGGPRLIPLLPGMLASLLRTAIKTFLSGLT